MENFTLIGGMPSSGSSLLSTMLDCHPEVYCGPETGIFGQPALWNKSQPLKDVILAKSMNIAQGVTWVGPSKFGLAYNGSSREEFVSYLSGDPNIDELISWLFASRKERHNTKFVCEKTPSNAYAIPSALRAYPQMKGVFVVRSLSGVVNSLLKRDYQIPYAVLRWLVAGNIAVNALEVYGRDRVHIVRYEDLILSTEATLRSLCAFLGVGSDAVSDMIALEKSERLRDDPLIQGDLGASAKWMHTPSQGVSLASLEVPELCEDALLYAKTLTLDEKLIEFYSHGINALTPSTISLLLGYPPLPVLKGHSVSLGEIRDILVEAIKLERPNTAVSRFYWEFLTGLS